MYTLKKWKCTLLKKWKCTLLKNENVHFKKMKMYTLKKWKCTRKKRGEMYT